MRPIYLCDLDAATRAVMSATRDQRADLAAQIVVRADSADRYRKRFHRAHAAYGVGTLTSAVQGMPRATATHCHADYRACLALILAALLHQSA